MRFPGAPTGTVATLDCFSGQARVVLATLSSDASWRVLGAGTAPLEGIEHGRVTHLSDAAETVSAALTAAEKSAGRKHQCLFYAFHDPQAAFRIIRASRTLSGEGQVRGADVRGVYAAAARLAGGFETVNVYSTGLGFVIDDQDPVADPVGVFGRKLEIEAGFLQARADELEVWRSVLKRAFCPLSWAVPLAQASVAGAFAAFSDRLPRVLWFDRDGQSLVCRAVGRSLVAVQDSSDSPEGLPDFSGDREVWVAGTRAEARFSALQQHGVSAKLAAAEGLTGFSSPEDVPTAGLFVVARERERLRLTVQRGRGLAPAVRNKLTAFWNEYF